VLLRRPACGGGAVDFFSEVEHIPSQKNRLSRLTGAQIGMRIFDSQPKRCVKGADDEQSGSSQRPLLIAGVGVSLSRVLNSTILSKQSPPSRERPCQDRCIAERRAATFISVIDSGREPSRPQLCQFAIVFECL
jgi:hypothetical protein